MSSKLAYTKPGQVKFTSPKEPAVPQPKSSKIAYTQPGQAKFTPKKPKFTEGSMSLRYLTECILFEANIEKLMVVNPKTKKRIKAKTALGYKHDHPAYLAALALIKKKHVTVPTPDIKKLKPGEQGSLFMTEPFEKPPSFEQWMKDAATEDVADKKLSRQFSEGNVDYSRDEREAIQLYCGSGFSFMNNYLRGNTDKAYEEYAQMYGGSEQEDSDFSYDDYAGSIDYAITSMDNAFGKAGTELQADVLTYRGIRGSSTVAEFLSAGVGATFKDNGFISTSVNTKTAARFAGIRRLFPSEEEENDPSRRAILQILTRKGTSVVYPSGQELAEQDDENEMILARDTTFKIHKIAKEKTHYIIQVEVVQEKE